MFQNGLVDLQVNGYQGVDFSDPGLTEESFAQACRNLLKAGTTAFCPTLITSSTETYQHNLALIGQVMEQAEFSGKLLGIHAEGPFLCPKPGAIGAHNPQWVRSPDPDFLSRMQEWAGGKIRLLTVAADVPGADQLARHAVRMGLVVSLGHHLADAEDLARLADAGATVLTHLGNGLPNILDRHHNPIWAGLAEDRLTAMIITDGHHLPLPLIKVIARVKGVDRLLVVSDASPAAGLPPGRHHVLGNDAILEPSGRLHNPEKGCLVGSSATIAQCHETLSAMNLFSPDELPRLFWHNPLQILGLSEVP